MNAVKLLLSLFLTLILTTHPTANIKPTKHTEYVYLCEGPYSKVYHRSDQCSGLSHCSTQVDKVPLEEAQRQGRRPCKIEYR